MFLFPVEIWYEIKVVMLYKEVVWSVTLEKNV